LDCKGKEQEVHAKKISERAAGGISPDFCTGCSL